MRWRSAALLPCSLLASGCLVTHPVDYATPEAAVATFQSAFAHDDEFGEYDCFAGAVKSAGVTQQAWSTERGRIFAPLGWFGRWWLRRDDLADELVTREEAPPEALLAALGRERDARDAARPAAVHDYELFGWRLRARLVAEPTLVIVPRDGAPVAVALAAARARLVAPVGGKAVLEAAVALPRELARRLAGEGAAQVRLERRYKLLPPEVYAAPEHDGSAVAEPRDPHPPRVHHEACDALIPKLREADFGRSEATFRLPLAQLRDAAAPAVDAIVWEPAAAQR